MTKITSVIQRASSKLHIIRSVGESLDILITCSHSVLTCCWIISFCFPMQIPGQEFHLLPAITGFLLKSADLRKPFQTRITCHVTLQKRCRNLVRRAKVQPGWGLQNVSSRLWGGGQVSPLQNKTPETDKQLGKRPSFPNSSSSKVYATCDSRACTTQIRTNF